MISQLSKLPEVSCSDYKPTSRALILKYALKTLIIDAGNLKETDLDILGPCLVSVTPADVINLIDPNVFYSRISYFTGIKSQLDSDGIEAISNKVNEVSKLSSAKQDPLQFLANINDLICFMNDLHLMNQVNFDLINHIDILVLSIYVNI